MRGLEYVHSFPCKLFSHIAMQLSSERKDPMEILEAYNSTHLVISGNSSHLAPWHAKLGFRNGPCISTLHHLNGDGGPVAAMAIVIIKVSTAARPSLFMHTELYFRLTQWHSSNSLKMRMGPRLVKVRAMRMKRTALMNNGGCVVALITLIHSPLCINSHDGRSRRPN